MLGLWQEILLSIPSGSAGNFLCQHPLLVIHQSCPSQVYFGPTSVKTLCNTDVTVFSLYQANLYESHLAHILKALLARN
jgi:hypothetical protein